MIKSNYALKLFTVVFLLSVVHFNSFAQGADANATTQASGAQEGNIDDLKVSPLRVPALTEVNGTPFLTTDYKTATVLTSKDKVVTEILVKYNIYSNAIMVKMDDGQEMRLESFKTVSYDDAAADGSVKHLQFAQGLPDVDNHNVNSVYQVMAAGTKVQLLKYITQKVEDAATLGDYSRRELVSTEQLYIYVPGGAIKKVKASKKDIVETLPALSAKIDEIAAANNLKLKSEAELITLVDALNK